jgi:hypothetical protein
MFLHATWGVILRYPLVERLHPELPLWHLGQVAQDAIGRRANQCMLVDWVVDLFPFELVEVFRKAPDPDPDPWVSVPPFELVETYALGGTTRQLLSLAYKLEPEIGRDAAVDEDRILEAFLGGAQEGARELAEAQARSLDRGSDLRGRIGELLTRTPRDRASFEEGQRLE